MPRFYRRGAALRPTAKPADPNSQYSKTLRAQIQRKLESLTEPPTPVRTLKDMSPEERAEMERLYGRR